jgi:hypothetical protein
VLECHGLSDLAFFSFSFFEVAWQLCEMPIFALLLAVHKKLFCVIEMSNCRFCASILLIKYSDSELQKQTTRRRSNNKAEQRAKP